MVVKYREVDGLSRSDELPFAGRRLAAGGLQKGRRYFNRYPAMNRGAIIGSSRPGLYRGRVGGE